MSRSEHTTRRPPANRKRERKGRNWFRLPVSPLRLATVVAVPFWAFLCLTDLLRAYGLSNTLPEALFAPISTRLVHHAALCAVSILMYWGALIIGFRPGRRLAAIGIQIVLALSFGFLSRPLFFASWIATEKAFTTSIFLQHFYELEALQLSSWLMVGAQNVIAYGFGLALMVCVTMYLRLRDEKLRAATLRSQWMSSRLRALRMQLNPHFLFNTLHTILALIGKEPAVAKTMLLRLSDLLRRVLEEGDSDQIPLSREIEFARNYLDIQSLRFKDRLTVSVEIDSNTRRALVPTMILQPIIENALVHGVSNNSDPTEVSITARRQDSWLEIAVGNTARGERSEPAGERHGIGIKNTRQRLETMFGEDYLFEAFREGGAKFVTRMRFPYVEAPLKSLAA